jgi:hypothetical protein
MAGTGYISALRHQFMQIMEPQGTGMELFIPLSQIYAKHQSIDFGPKTPKTGTINSLNQTPNTKNRYFGNDLSM